MDTIPEILASLEQVRKETLQCLNQLEQAQDEWFGVVPRLRLA